MDRRSALPVLGVLLLVGAGCAAPVQSPIDSRQGAIAPVSPSSGAASSSAASSGAVPTSSPSDSGGAATSPGESPSTSPGSGPSASIDPANFTSTVDNEWFPLTPGTTFTYRGTKDDKRAVDIYAVSSKTQLIDGVECRVVNDRLFLGGVLAERTTDYYVQDRDGNVWYFGEDTAELDAKGRVTSTEGTWRAGVDGALPGIFMEAKPTVGHSFAQEFYSGQAEDHFEVLSLSASVKVPFGSFSGTLRTREWTPLEPDFLDNKYYVRGIGEVKEVTVKGPLEELRLVSIKRSS